MCDDCVHVVMDGRRQHVMTVAMLRLADEIGGEIRIDGVSHASMTHEQLRSKLAIIPQEATMFAGTLRSCVESNFSLVVAPT